MYMELSEGPGGLNYYVEVWQNEKEAISIRMRKEPAVISTGLSMCRRFLFHAYIDLLGT